MNLLVTGVAGFIGSNFVYHYLDRHPERTITGIDNLSYAGNLDNLSALTDEQRERFLFVKADITNPDQVRKIFEDYPVDGVINMAAETHVDRSIYDPQVFLKTNILGTHVLLEAAKHSWQKHGAWKKGSKFLQVSTDEVYGTLGESGFFSETTPIDPHSPYSASKASADLIVKAYHDTYGMPVTITRCSNNYGAYQFPEKLIPLVITNALHHSSIPVYGDGKQVRDWLYVEDHCRAIDLVFEKGRSGETYNIGGNTEKENIIIIKEVLCLLEKMTGDTTITQELISFVKDRPGHDRRYAIDASKIRKELGWYPRVPFQEGIDKTVRWYIDHQDWMSRVMSGEYRDFYEKNYNNRNF
ncbi:MAG: dTDP-glucose 4,6-dehydratase [Methanomicrobiales archaeon]